MQIVDLELTQAYELTNFYNEQFSDQSYYYPVTPDEFDKWTRHGFWGNYPDPNLSGEKFIVGKQKGRIVGYSHVAKDTRNSDGVFRFFNFQPGFRAIAQAILSESECYLRELGAKRFRACGSLTDQPGYRFHRLASEPLTDSMMHLRGLFGINGYQLVTQSGRYARFLFMSASLGSLVEPKPPKDGVEILVERKSLGDMGRSAPPGHVGPGFLNIMAYRKGQKIAHCESYSMGLYNNAPQAQDVFFVGDLGVLEEERGKGMGRYLMERTHWEIQQKGYRFAVLYVRQENHLAQLLYTSMGYRVVDTTMRFVKKLDT